MCKWENWDIVCRDIDCCRTELQKLERFLHSERNRRGVRPNVSQYYEIAFLLDFATAYFSDISSFPIRIKKLEEEGFPDFKIEENNSIVYIEVTRACNQEELRNRMLEKGFGVSECISDSEFIPELVTCISEASKRKRSKKYEKAIEGPVWLLINNSMHSPLLSLEYFGTCLVNSLSSWPTHFERVFFEEEGGAVLDITVPSALRIIRDYHCR